MLCAGRPRQLQRTLQRQHTHLERAWLFTMVLGRSRRLRGFGKLVKVVEGVQFKDGIETGETHNQMAA